MIIQSLVEQYDIVAENSESNIAQIGWDSEKVSFVLNLAEDGHLIGILM